MTREQVDRASQFEKDFRYAINSNFMRMQPAPFAELCAIYSEVFGKKLTASQMTCNTCRLRTVQTLGEEWFKWKAYYEKKDEEEKNAQEQTEEKPKKKVGRPRKINLDE